MSRIALSIAVSLVTLDASATPINLIDATYEVSLRNLIRLEKPATEVTATFVDDEPISESLSALNDPYPGDHPPWPLEAEGIADTLSLYVHTNGPSDFSVAEALAMTTLLFSPIADTPTVIDISWFAQGDVQNTGGFFSLTDVTTQTELGSFGWEMPGFPFRREGTGFVGGTSFAANLNASDIYQLTLRTQSQGNHDIQFMTVNVAGLEVVSVPEPATLSLLIAGLALLTGSRTRRDRTSRPRP